MKLLEGKCPECGNSIKNIDIDHLKHKIESTLANKWFDYKEGTI